MFDTRPRPTANSTPSDVISSDARNLQAEDSSERPLPTVEVTPARRRLAGVNPNEARTFRGRAQDGRREALKRYSRRNERMVEAFNDEVAQGSPTARLYHSFVLQVVSEHIWEHAAGQPGWEALDVDAFQRSILQQKLALDEVATGNFNLTLTAFYTWLARRNLLRPAQAARVIQQLQRYDNAYVSRLMRRLAPRAA